MSTTIEGPTLEIGADTHEVHEAIGKVGESLETLKSIGEALGLEKVFETLTETVHETTAAFAQHEAELRRISAVTTGTDAAHQFDAMATSLSQMGDVSKTAALQSAALLGQFSLTDAQIGQLLPKIADFAVGTGTDMVGAAERMGAAISSGEASIRRLGIDLGEQGRAAFKAADETTRLSILMQAMGRYAGQSSEASHTAAAAQLHLHDATEELHVAIGGLLDAPMASFLEGVRDRVDGLTEAIQHLSPETKQALGDMLAFGLNAAQAAAALGAAAAAAKALGGMSSALMPVLETLGGISTTARVLADIDVGEKFASFALMWNDPRLKNAPSLLEKIVDGFKGIVTAIAGFSATPIIAAVGAVAALGATTAAFFGTLTRIQAGEKFEGSFKDEFLKSMHVGLADSLGGGGSGPKPAEGAVLDFAGAPGALLDTTSKKVDPYVAAIAQAFADKGTGLALQSQALAQQEITDLLNKLPNAVGTATDAQRKQAVADIQSEAGSFTDLKKQQADLANQFVENSKSSVESQAQDALAKATPYQPGRAQNLLASAGQGGAAISNAITAGMTGGPAAAAASLGASILQNTVAFNTISKQLTGLFNILSNTLSPVLYPLIDILQIVTNAVKALQPVFKAIGDAFTTFGDWIVTIANAFGANIQPVNNDLQAFGVGLTATANTLDVLNNSLGSANENIPEGFKVALDQYNSIDPNAANAANEQARDFADSIKRANEGVSRFGLGFATYSTGISNFNDEVQHATITLSSLASAASAWAQAAGNTSGAANATLGAGRSGASGIHLRDMDTSAAVAGDVNITINAKNADATEVANKVQQVMKNIAYLRSGLKTQPNPRFQFGG